MQCFALSLFYEFLGYQVSSVIGVRCMHMGGVLNHGFPCRHRPEAGLSLPLRGGNAAVHIRHIFRRPCFADAKPCDLIELPASGVNGRSLKSLFGLDMLALAETIPFSKK